jgi:hypothetical protein
MDMPASNKPSAGFILVKSVPTAEKLDAPSLTGHLPQGRIDAVLPSWTVLLKEFQHILINPQGDGLLHAWDGRCLGRLLDRLGRRFLEGGLSGLERIARAPPSR